MTEHTTNRTAVYGPVCTVVWEGPGRKARPYPDQGRQPLETRSRADPSPGRATLSFSKCVSPPSGAWGALHLGNQGLAPLATQYRPLWGLRNRSRSPENTWSKTAQANNAT